MSIVLGKTFSESKNYTIPADKLIMGRTFLSSITRYGKSWTCRRIIEQLVGKAGIVIVDPEGEYASLREKFPFLIIGKDVPVQVETAEFLAETVLKEELSVIIDLSMVDDDTGKEFVAAFITHFMFLETRFRKPYLFVVEEGDEFGPERGIAKATSEKPLRNMAKKGGKRGIGLILVSHRPAWVSKGILSQCTSLKIVGRIEWSSDLDVLKEFLQIQPNILRKPRKNGKSIDDGKPHIESLKPGEFFVTGSIVEEAFVKVGKVQTTHLGATPEVIPPTPKELMKVVTRLSEALPKILEQKIKPEAQRIAEIQKETETKLKSNYEKKLAKEVKKIEAKFQSNLISNDQTIKDLHRKLEALGRSQDLQSGQFAPIKDVFDHPIVKARMAKLEQREIDLLRKIEQTPDLGREQLAAFLNSSKDTVKNLISKVNRIFHAEVIVGDGRPVRYKSMLKRLYITDVAKREISEISRLQNKVTELEVDRERLQSANRSKQAMINGLEEQIKNAPKTEQLSQLKTLLQTKTSLLENTELKLKEARKQLHIFTNRFEKIKSIVADVSVEPPIDEKTSTKKPIVVNENQKTPVETPNTPLNRNHTQAAFDKAHIFLEQHKGTFFQPMEIAIAVNLKAIEQKEVFERLQNNPTIEYNLNHGYRIKKESE